MTMLYYNGEFFLRIMFLVQSIKSWGFCIYQSGWLKPTGSEEGIQALASEKLIVRGAV